MDDERDPTGEELREAAALASALEGEAAEGAPEDALEAAALLRAGQQGELSELRERAVQKRVLKVEAAAEDDEEAEEPAARWLRWIAPAATVAAAAAVMLVFIPGDRPEGTSLPTPGSGLLRAQAAAARGEAADAAMLQVGMRRFRARYFAALERRYRGAE